MNASAALLRPGQRIRGGMVPFRNKGDNMTATDNKTVELATAFCRILREWLTREQLTEVVHMNAISASSGDHGVCHSHDHCDANQAMLDAWEQVFGKDAVPAGIREGATDDEASHDDLVWNEAWALAKKKGFSL